MPNTKLFLLCALFASACAGGDGDDTNADDTSGGSVDPTTSSSDTMTTGVTMTTDMTTSMTTAPTTAETLTTDDTLDSSGTDDPSTGEPADLSCESYCGIYATACADFAEYAHGKKIVVMRTESGRQVSFPFNYEDVVARKNLRQNIDLKPGDTVIVP